MKTRKQTAGQPLAACVFALPPPPGWNAHQHQLLYWLPNGQQRLLSLDVGRITYHYFTLFSIACMKCTLRSLAGSGLIPVFCALSEETDANSHLLGIYTKQVA